MPDLSWGSYRYNKQRESKRREYAKKLRALGIIEGSTKWHKLMYRKFR